MNRHLRDIQRCLDEIRQTSPGAVHVVAECQRALDALKPKAKRIRHALPGPSRKAAKEAKRAKHREETAAIREAAMKRCGGKCEGYYSDPYDVLCFHQCTGPAVHMHHLEGGNGRRRQRQTVENVRMLCEWHHREAHRAARRPPEGKQDERAPQDKETRR